MKLLDKPLSIKDQEYIKSLLKAIFVGLWCQMILKRLCIVLESLWIEYLCWLTVL